MVLPIVVCHIPGLVNWPTTSTVGPKNVIAFLKDIFQRYPVSPEVQRALQELNRVEVETSRIGRTRGAVSLFMK
jgi:hypothetical protein